jgi:WAS family protein 1
MRVWSLQERKKDAKKESEAPKAAGGGGDLLGDLATRLKMRRKGISGDKGEKEREKEANAQTGGGGMFDQIAAMMPAGRDRSASVVSAADWTDNDDDDDSD